MLDDYIDWYRAGMVIAYVCLDAYAVGLWWFAVKRTGLPFFRLWLTAGLAYLLFDILHVVVTVSEERLKWDVFGPHTFARIAHTEYVVRPFVTIAALIAATMMVRWAARIKHRENDTTRP